MKRTARLVRLSIVTAAVALTPPAAGFAQSQSFASASPASPSAAPQIDYKAILARYAHAKWTYPDSEQIADAYPRRAQDERIQGVAQVACFIQADGHMKRCVVLAEDPTGERFGQATSDVMLKYAEVDPASVDGGIQPGDFKIITLNWRIN